MTEIERNFLEQCESLARVYDAQGSVEVAVYCRRQAELVLERRRRRVRVVEVGGYVLVPCPALCDDGYQHRPVCCDLMVMADTGKPGCCGSPSVEVSECGTCGATGWIAEFPTEVAEFADDGAAV